MISYLCFDLYLDKKLGGYILVLKDTDYTQKELYKVLQDIKLNITKHNKLLVIGFIPEIKNHLKFYTRLGSKVIYELTS